MPNQNIDLGNTDDVQFNSNDVEKLYLNSDLIWEKYEDFADAVGVLRFRYVTFISGYSDHTVSEYWNFHAYIDAGLSHAPWSGTTVTSIGLKSTTNANGANPTFFSTPNQSYGTNSIHVELGSQSSPYTLSSAQLQKFYNCMDYHASSPSNNIKINNSTTYTLKVVHLQGTATEPSAGSSLITVTSYHANSSFVVNQISRQTDGYRATNSDPNFPNATVNGFWSTDRDTDEYEYEEGSFSYNRTLDTYFALLA